MTAPTTAHATASFGMWMMLPSPELAAAASAEGYDYVALDRQHGYIAQHDVPVLARAIRSAGDAQVTVRCTKVDFAELGALADAGVDTVIVPLISSAADAAECVRALNYPPVGERSWGPTADLVTGSPDPTDSTRRPQLLVMIENKAGLDALEEICTVPGIDGIYIGPSDLAFALGHTPGVPHVEIETTIEDIRTRVEHHGLVAAIHCGSGAEAQTRAAQGFTVVTSAIDVLAARGAFAHELTTARH
ncbi:HpcH/HpaI aldolase family protein [Nesterenkonia sandarakina]|uniref:4-hydroxy-2-oxoheptanedioate aldolase n=1 Tax=Nesterenkonia sandarakina TaxID=272918 RepID=A0A7Z0EAJ2_9MICC|nr:aldolase/citrate lyase family protein [Nesterenkonia sandarakina]NYJ18102.1 4-hydroxy-2-oxoheptanedioate aldolase [Nesterenkonia sandarakina]